MCSRCVARQKAVTGGALCNGAGIEDDALYGVGECVEVGRGVDYRAVVVFADEIVVVVFSAGHDVEAVGHSHKGGCCRSVAVDLVKHYMGAAQHGDEFVKRSVLHNDQFGASGVAVDDGAGSLLEIV